ncbi:MAG: hypothetical protein ACPIA3_02980, partial [Pseudomonadales bacterium]
DAAATDHPDTDKLQATVNELTQRSAAAAEALVKFESQLGVDPEAIKAAQVEWAKANAKVRKLTKLAPEDDATDAVHKEYQQTLAAAEQDLQQAESHLQSLKNPTEESS